MIIFFNLNLSIFFFRFFFFFSFLFQIFFSFSEFEFYVLRSTIIKREFYVFYWFYRYIIHDLRFLWKITLI